MILADLDPGRNFVVSRVRVAGETGRRLADMGFTQGAEGEMIRGAFLRGPMQVRIRGYDLLMRRGEAACIEVEPASAARLGRPAAGAKAAPAPEARGERAAAGIPGGLHEAGGRGFAGAAKRFGRALGRLFAADDCCGPKGAGPGGGKRRGAGRKGGRA